MEEKDSGFYLRRGIKAMNGVVGRIPPVSDEPGDPEELIRDMAALKVEIRDAAEAALQDMQKAAELDPGNFETESRVKEGVANLNDIEILDVFPAIEHDRMDHALKTLSGVLKKNPHNMQAKKLYDRVRSNHCWFCRTKGIPNLPDPSAVIKVPMHKVTEREQSRVRWERTEISVPRCSRCRSVHHHDYRIGAGAGLAAGLLVNVLAGLYAAHFDILYFLAVCLITTGAGILSHSIYSGISRRSSHPEKHQVHFPPLIKRALEEWSPGGDPPGISGYPVSRGGAF